MGGRRLSYGFNPLVADSDEDGILDSLETITQTVDLEINQPIDINQTLVKPGIQITGAGDYYGRIYAEPILDNPAIDALGCVVGKAFEFLHDEELTFEKSTLSFTISEVIAQGTPIEDLAIAYYDYDNQVLEVLETTSAVTGGAITSEATPEYLASVEAASGSAIIINAVSGSAITINAVSKSAISYTISTEVDHYSTYMVVNKTLVNREGNRTGNASMQGTGTFQIRLSNGLNIRVLKDPAFGDRSVDSDGDGLCDLDELGFRYHIRTSGDTSQLLEVWTYHTNPASKDTDKDGYQDNRDYRDNTLVYIDYNKHLYKPSNMIMNGDSYFIDVNFNKYPYCVNNAKGEYVRQAESWLLNLGLISKVDGKYERQDIIAVAYLQKKYKIGSNGIIDNKTYGLLWALDEINQHKNDVLAGIRTKAELEAYNASVLYQSSQERYSNPDYTKDYYSVYYNMILNHVLVGTESYATLLSMFPGGEIYDVAKFLYDVSHYKKGDKAKIVADLVALGIDGVAVYADEKLRLLAYMNEVF